jgi:hypothetical protein
MLQTRALLAAAVLSAVTSIAVQGSPASATPPAAGCPSGFTLAAVSDLAQLGYRVPGIVDDPANTYGFGHQPGNGDGLVCARLLGKTDNATGQPLYEFFDDTLPSS